MNGNLLEFFLNRRRQEVQKLFSFPFQDIKEFRQDYNDYDKDLKHIYNTIFNSKSQEIFLKKILPFQIKTTPMPVCNLLFMGNQEAYRCYDCMTHEAAVVCGACFENGNHKGHRYTKINSMGGNCDCGNPDAISPQGFCINHKGVADEIMVDQKQESLFLSYMTQIFIWILKMYKLKFKKQCLSLFTFFIRYLDQLNHNSLYYNTLTNKFLFQNQCKVIHHIFTIGTQEDRNCSLSQKATELFLKIFSLEKFKFNLATEFIVTYNTLPSFQESRFNSLYIQLFANNDLVVEVINASNISLDPRERQYSIITYYSHLKFLSSIKPYAAKVFFKPILKKGGIDFPLMKLIENNIQKDSQNQQFLYQHINIQNIYYELINDIIILMKQQPQILKQMLVGYYKLILKHSFKKNKIIITYQRVFIIIIFAIFDCQLSKIDAIVIAEILQIESSGLVIFIKKLIRQLFGCLSEYADCLNRHTYFTNYLPLYIENGNKIIIYDILGLKICAFILNSLNLHSDFSDELISKYQWDLKSLKSGYDQIVTAENESNLCSKLNDANQKIMLSRWLSLILILSQIVYSNRAEIMLAKDLKYESDQIKRQMMEQLKSIFVHLKQVSLDEMSLITKYFFKKEVKKNLLSQITIFDKTKKKYIVKSDVICQPISFQYLISLQKIAKPFSNRSNDQQKNYFCQLGNKNKILRDTIFCNHFLNKILYAQLNLIIRQTQLKTPLIKQFIFVLDRISRLLSYHSEIILDIITKIRVQNGNSLQIMEALQLLKQKGISNASEDQKKEKQISRRKQILKKKKAIVLNKIKQNQQFCLNKQAVGQAENEFESDRCIVCHDGNSSQLLCYLSRFQFTNMVYSLMNRKGINLSFHSCFHPVHLSCFKNIAKENQFIICPLCKLQANIVLPLLSNCNQSALIKDIIDRIQFLMALSTPRKFHHIYFQLLMSFIPIFCIKTAEQNFFNQKQILLAQIILKVMSQIYLQFNTKQKQMYNQDALKKIIDQHSEEKDEKYNFVSFLDIVLNCLFLYTSQLSIKLNEVQMIVSKNIKKLAKSQILFLVKSINQLLMISNLEPCQFQHEAQQMQSKLSNLFKFYQPPSSAIELIKVRDSYENECKMGHNICICLICCWVGCNDCKKTINHGSKCHMKQSLYFSLLTGGIIILLKSNLFIFDSFYVNQTGKPWKASANIQQYYLEQILYKQVKETIKNGDLSHYLVQNKKRIVKIIND